MSGRLDGAVVTTKPIRLNVYLPDNNDSLPVK